MKPTLMMFALSALCACSGGDSDDSGADASLGQFDANSATTDAAADAQPEPDAAPQGTVCNTKDVPVQLGYTCDFTWGSCTGGSSYEISCRIQNLAGNVFSLCDCIQNGNEGSEFLSTEICGSSDWADLEAIANEECGWDLL